MCILFGGWACFMLGLGVWGISDGFTTWKLPFWNMPFGIGLFIAVFQLVWFGGVLAGCRLLILGMEFIVMDQEEIKFCVGPVVLRRLHFSEIKTVVRTGGDMSEWPQTPLRSTYPKKKTRNLVFSMETADELRMRSRNWHNKRKAKKQQVRMMDQKSATNEEVKRYFERRMLFTPYWMEWCTDAEATLRANMTTTTFIL